MCERGSDMNTYIPGVESDIRILGRSGRRQEPAFFWTGSGIEFTVDGSELSIDFVTDYDIYEQWIRIEVDGFTMIRTSLAKGRSTITVYRNMKPENRRKIRVLKEVQPMMADRAGLLFINAVHTDGQLMPLEKKPYRLEFVGDSITSGEGMAGARGVVEWNSAMFSTNGHYVLRVADELNADYRIISQSGWGVCSSWDNDPRRVLPLYYEQVCGLLGGRAQLDAGAGDRNDFTAWKPDVVLVNLGTNDAYAFQNREWVDEKTGEKFRQKLNADGSFEAKSLERFEKAVYNFLVLLRKNNADAHIVWLYGMIGRAMEPYILDAMNKYKKDFGDENVSYLQLPDLKDEWTGANNHPGIPSHSAAAQTITEYLREELK